MIRPYRKMSGTPCTAADLPRSHECSLVSFALPCPARNKGGRGTTDPRGGTT